MNLNELIVILEQIAKEGKGDYLVFDEGYMNEITESENITIDDDKGRIYL